MHRCQIAIIFGVCLFQTSCVSSPVCTKFNIAGAKAVLLRARNAEQAKITVPSNDSTLTVCGIPSGGAEGYHPADPNWRETPPSEWGLEFRAQRFGDTLVVSSFNEVEYIHHRYYFEKLKITAPKGVAVKLENRTLSGEGKADLSEPKAF